MIGTPWVLGLSASHNGAACLMHGPEIVVAVQEERLTRVKRHRVRASAPSLCIQYCLTAAGIAPGDLDLVVLATQASSRSPEDDIHLNPLLRVDANRIPVLAVGHHLAHAASVFYPSGWQDAAILVVDGMGSPEHDLSDAERRAIRHPVRNGYESVSLYAGTGREIIPVEKHLVEDGQWLVMSDGRMPRFGTLGGLFSSVSHQIFRNPMDAGKVMGLAPYGTPEIAAEDFFSSADGVYTFSDVVPGRFDGRQPWPDHRRDYENLASSTQAALECAVLELADRGRRVCRSSFLCYTGGVALNSVANTRIASANLFDDLYIFPAAEDSGVAVGAAYIGVQRLLPTAPPGRVTRDSFGATYTDAHVDGAIRHTPGICVRSSPHWLDEAADLICRGHLVGWFQLGAELGPRALGQRSIVCDPRVEANKDALNARVKKREPFRPFAPAILEEQARDWFEIPASHGDNPFMLRVYPFRSERRDLVPAVVHVDGTGRVQTVSQAGNPLFYRLIEAFHGRTGIPLLLNTSMNVMGEPIVETPGDALVLLLTSGLDACVIGSRLVTKQSARTSLLEFVPFLIAEAVASRHVVDDTGVRSAGATIECRVHTPWGPDVRSFPSDCLPLVAAVDGRRAGFEILSVVEHEAGVSAARAEVLLHQLTRARVVWWRS